MYVYIDFGLLMFEWNMAALCPLNRFKAIMRGYIMRIIDTHFKHERGT